MLAVNTLQRRTARKVERGAGGSWEDRKGPVSPAERERFLIHTIVLNGTYLVPQGTYGAETLRPVSILQVLNASQPHPDASFSIDDVEITQVHPLSLSLPSYHLISS